MFDVKKWRISSDVWLAAWQDGATLSDLNLLISDLWYNEKNMISTLQLIIFINIYIMASP